MGKRKRRNSNSRDRISELSDDVIGIIISHLKMEEAVRTSVLSRRWKYLWKLTTCFNLNVCGKLLLTHWRHVISSEEREELIDKTMRNYISWVEHLVDNHEGSHLDEFVAEFNLGGTHTTYLDKWITFAVRKRAKTIKLKLFPHVFSEKEGYYSFIKTAPALSGIECLRSLCLARLSVTGELIEQLLSVCPQLERLSLSSAGNLRKLKVIGSSLKLKYFDIEHCYDLKSIEICAPNLQSFRWILQRPGRLLQVENLSSLVDLDITHSNIYVLSRFSSCFSHLETLTFSSPLNKRLLKLLEHSQFTNLKHLTFTDNCHVRDYMRCLPEFISLCPALHKFTLHLNSWGNGTRLREIKWRKRRLEGLKVVELISFLGHDDEIKIFRFFLRNAIKLNNIIIQPRSTIEQALLRRAEQLRTKIPRGVELLIKPRRQIFK